MGDPLKIVIFAAAFLLLLLLGRKLSAAGEIHPYQPSPEPDQPPTAAGEIHAYHRLDQPTAPTQTWEEEIGGRKRPAMTGADLPFPIRLPDLKMYEEGRYNRPEFLNYYFDKTDLVHGPPDPAVFIDNFYVETRDPGNERQIAYSYVVCTPAGLQRVLDNEHLPSLYMEDDLVVVPRWSLPAILTTVTEEIIKLYQPDGFPLEVNLPDNEEAETQ